MNENLNVQNKPCNVVMLMFLVIWILNLFRIHSTLLRTSFVFSASDSRDLLATAWRFAKTSVAVFSCLF